MVNIILSLSTIHQIDIISQTIHICKFPCRGEKFVSGPLIDSAVSFSIRAEIPSGLVDFVQFKFLNRTIISYSVQ